MNQHVYKYNFLYKITNLINGKFYYGIHSTNDIDDGYMGSGVMIKKAIKKYGRSNFKKEIIQFTNDRESLILLEKQFINEELLKDKVRHKMLEIVDEFLEDLKEQEIKIKVDKELCRIKNDVQKKCFDFLNQAEIEFFLKDRIYGVIQKENRLPILIASLQTMGLDEKLLAVLMEIITAKMN